MNHYHAKDLIERLTVAKNNKQPVYPAKGPCGGCDLAIPLNVDEIIKSLQAIESENPPIYAAEGPCGGCDIHINHKK